MTHETMLDCILAAGLLPAVFAFYWRGVGKMENMRIMPYEEKYRLVKENTAFTERVVGDFVREKLGNRAFAELYTRWKDNEKTIPREAPL